MTMTNPPTSWLRPGPGVEIRRPGEPCPHTHRVSYTDEGGVYSRCAVCGTQLTPTTAQIEAERLLASCEICHGAGIVATGGPDHWGNFDTDDCPCQARAPRVEQCCRCGVDLTAQDPATTTLGPRCRECWGRSW